MHAQIRRKDTAGSTEDNNDEICNQDKSNKADDDHADNVERWHKEGTDDGGDDDGQDEEEETKIGSGPSTTMSLETECRSALEMATVALATADRLQGGATGIWRNRKQQQQQKEAEERDSYDNKEVKKNVSDKHGNS